MKKRIGICLSIFLLLISLFCLGIVFLGYCYKDVFPAFIWVDDIYCTGKTAEEVNSQLMQKSAYEGIRVVDISGAELLIKPEDIDMTISYLDDVELIQKSRGGLYWWKSFYGKRHFTARATVYFDSGKLDDILANWEAFPSYDNEFIYITEGSDGYELVNNGQNFPNIEEIQYAVFCALLELKPSIELADAQGHYGMSCYSDLEPANNDQKHLVSLYEKVNALQNKGYSLEFAGTNISLGRKEISDFLLTARNKDNLFSEDEESEDSQHGKFIVNNRVYDKDELISSGIYEDNGFIVDENDNLILSVEKIYDYASALSKKYDTSWCLNNYKNGIATELLINETRKGDGSLINTEAEFERIKNVFLNLDNDSLDNQKLTLNDNVKVYDASEKLGNTYIEVNMNRQQLKYYVDGELSMEMPVVTGNINRKRGTPAGIFDVYNKRYHTYLRGADYVSYVNYWLGVNKGVGIHDATWRNKFGEEIYKSDGSHGCINCPKDQVSLLWEVADIGTPVILYY
ncbi:L,D-transpeptidase [Butyrivibrio sp. YAB3001]|uniref:L,D-transpeptidase n=1 Tax=Butyrivibrio sp. YAB3001 TaxID=1520812 RepID=UPI0008F67473|nr:L,D-transpeptidase [Butyrivibrio sp. YAB3001]SFB66578.1 L,D-transpeptidase catalytic domain [Butyrivibrio sp. YAB3001]